MVGDHSSITEGDDSSSSFSYTDIFESKCGEYLAYGMTLEQYWDGSSDLCRYYRDKARFEQKQRNFDAWIQGMYIYDLLGRVHEMLVPFVSSPSVKPYVDKPYPLTEREIRVYEEEKKKEEMQKTYDFFMNAMKAQKRKRKEEENGKC